MNLTQHCISVSYTPPHCIIFHITLGTLRLRSLVVAEGKLFDILLKQLHVVREDVTSSLLNRHVDVQHSPW
jgi:hypothetical protein